MFAIANVVIVKGERRLHVLDWIDGMRGREEHKRDVVCLIRKGGPCSRPEIASKLGLNLATVSGLTRELLTDDLLIERGHTPSEGGRRAALLAINPEFAHVIGCAISVRAVKGRLTDLSGRPVDRVEGGGFEPGDRGSMLDALWGVVDGLLARAGDRSVEGIGVGIAGLVDASGRTSRAFPSPGDWRDVPLAEMIEERYGLDAFVDNNVQCKALAETRFGAGRGLDHLVYLHVGSGIRVGLIIDGEPYRGGGRNAGEIGHHLAEKEGPLCTCGKTGCLESVASPPAIEAQAREALEKGVRTLLSQMCEEDPSRIDMDMILRASSQGDRLAVNLLDRAGEYLGTALAGVVDLLNPQAVVFGGLLGRGHKQFNGAIERSFRSRVLRAFKESTQIRLARLGDDAASVGAACLAFDERFRSGAVVRGREKVQGGRR